ncbi:hypothetical protein [Paraburkholderia terricola]|nr:hypothetical protein [Paraburkholderia terricola]
MSLPVFFFPLPNGGGSSAIPFFDLNKGKGRFVHFECDRQGRESCRARRLATRIGGGQHAYRIHRSTTSTANYHTVLPLVFETNRTSGSQKSASRLSGEAKTEFVEDNSFDYELFVHANSEIEKRALESGSNFSKDRQWVQRVVARINEPENSPERLSNAGIRRQRWHHA